MSRSSHARTNRLVEALVVLACLAFVGGLVVLVFSAATSRSDDVPDVSVDSVDVEWTVKLRTEPVGGWTDVYSVSCVAGMLITKGAVEVSTELVDSCDAAREALLSAGAQQIEPALPRR